MTRQILAQRRRKKVQAKSKWDIMDAKEGDAMRQSAKEEGGEQSDGQAFGGTGEE
jgi:hypothetical protein